MPSIEARGQAHIHQLAAQGAWATGRRRAINGGGNLWEQGVLCLRRAFLDQGPPRQQPVADRGAVFNRELGHIQAQVPSRGTRRRSPGGRAAASRTLVLKGAHLIERTAKATKPQRLHLGR